MPKDPGKKRASGKGRRRRLPGEGTADGRWEGSIHLGFDASGRRIRKSVYGDSLDEVQRQLLELKSKAAAGTLVLTPDKLTVEQYFDSWLQTLTLDPKTISGYRQMVRTHIIPTLGKLTLLKLEPIHLQQLYAQKLKDGKAPRTVQLIHSILRKALGDALRMGRVTRNVAVAVKAPKPQRKPVKTLTRDQVKSFLRVLEGHRLYALYVLDIHTGLRQSELLGLRWADVDLDNGVIHVQQTIQRVDRQVVVKATKNKSSRRSVALTEPIVALLRRHRAQQAQEKLLQGQAYQDHGLVFATIEGKPLNGSTVYHTLQKLLLKAGLERVRFHDLRHTMATLLMEQGVNPKIVSERLGHSSIQVTMDLYSHVTPHMQREAASKLDDMLPEEAPVPPRKGRPNAN